MCAWNGCVRGGLSQTMKVLSRAVWGPGMLSVERVGHSATGETCLCLVHALLFPSPAPLRGSLVSVCVW